MQASGVVAATILRTRTDIPRQRHTQTHWLAYSAFCGSNPRNPEVIRRSATDARTPPLPLHRTRTGLGAWSARRARAQARRPPHRPVSGRGGRADGGVTGMADHDVRRSGLNDVRYALDLPGGAGARRASRAGTCPLTPARSNPTPTPMPHPPPAHPRSWRKRPHLPPAPGRPGTYT